MNKDGLAVASEETTSAPKGMYREEEQDEGVARGHIRVKEVIAYDFVKMQVIMDELTGKPTDMKRKIEKGRGPYFYQDIEDFLVFKENNPNARLETFGIQILKSTAKKYIDKAENMEQFARKEGGAK